MPQLLSGRPSQPQPRTHPLVWFAAFICVIISVTVIIAGIVVFVGYLAIHPRVPSISVIDAHLNLLRYSPAGVLETQITAVVQAENENKKADATFYNTKFKVSFNGQDIAYLVAPMFEVDRNKTVDLNYVIESLPVPLGQLEMQNIDTSLKRDEITFDLKGSTRARWRVWLLGSVKFWCHLNCKLSFRPSDHSYIYSKCTSKAKKD